MTILIVQHEMFQRKMAKLPWIIIETIMHLHKNFEEEKRKYFLFMSTVIRQIE